MFIDQLINQTSVPALAQLMQFTAARHELLVNNIANIDTPGYRVRDLSVADFQQAMAKAVKDRPLHGGQLVLRGEQVRSSPDGKLTFNPADKAAGTTLFHDQARRQVEREMADLAENTLTHNIAAEMLKAQFNQLKMAIRQRF